MRRFILEALNTLDTLETLDALNSPGPALLLVEDSESETHPRQTLAEALEELDAQENLYTLQTLKVRTDGWCSPRLQAHEWSSFFPCGK